MKDNHLILEMWIWFRDSLPSPFSPFPKDFEVFPYLLQLYENRVILSVAWNSLDSCLVNFWNKWLKRILVATV